MFNKAFDLNEFIRQKVTERSESLFNPDLEAFKTLLEGRINNTSILVIGGAGTIGSAFIKAILRFKPSRLIVVDTNEN